MNRTFRSIGGGYSRYHSIDKLKFVCAFLVVCIHAPIPGVFGEYFMTLTRIAVPTFFMISGFFYEPRHVQKLIRRVFIYLLIGNIVYFLVHLGIKFLQGNVVTYIKDTFTMQNAINFMIFNESPFHVHLWYLGSILYVYFFVMVLEKMVGDYSKAQDYMLMVTPILLICDLAFGKYSILLFGQEFKTIYMRNWLFVGLPYFSIGKCLRRNRESIELKLRKVGTGWTLVFTILFILTTFIEHYVLVKIGANATRDHYFSTTMLAVSVFMLFLMFFNKRTMSSDIGRNDSTWIYILHPAFIILTDAISGRFKIYGYFYFRPFLVFIASILCSEFILRIQKMWFNNQNEMDLRK